MAPQPLLFDKFVAENAAVAEMQQQSRMGVGSLRTSAFVAGTSTSSQRPATQDQQLMMPASPSNRQHSHSPKHHSVRGATHQLNTLYTDNSQMSPNVDNSAIRFVDTSTHREHLVPRPDPEEDFRLTTTQRSALSYSAGSMRSTGLNHGSMLAAQAIPQRTFVTNGNNVEIEAADAHFAPVNPQHIELKAFDETTKGNALASIQRGNQTVTKKALWSEKANQFKLSRTLDREHNDKRAELEGLYTKLTESLRDPSGGIKEVVPVRYRREKFKLHSTKAEKIKPTKEGSQQILAMEEKFLMSPKQRRELLKQQVHQQQARKQIRAQLAKETRMNRIIDGAYRAGGMVAFEEDTHQDREEQLLRSQVRANERQQLLLNKQHSSEGRKTFQPSSSDPQQKLCQSKKKAEFSHLSDSHINDIPPSKPVNEWRRARLHDKVNGGKQYDIITGRQLTL